MKSKRIIAIFLSIFLILISILSCLPFIFRDMTSASRIKQESDGSIIIIDPETVALSGNPALVTSSCLVILNNINNVRAAAGLGSLAQTNELMAAATIRAKEQAQSFSHTRPNGSEFWTVDSSVCYGECLSKGYNENEVTDAWMNSPSHKAIIMDNGYKTMGVGIHEENGVCYIALETGY